MTLVDEAQTLREARGRYFEENGFGPDGGYAKKWVKLELGPVPLAIPNTASRVRAVRFHDLHHVLTGYATDWRGEAQISAWEIGSGCADMWAAWLLNLQGLLIGIAVDLRATVRAFARGRRTRNLYRESFGDSLLSQSVAEMRRRLSLDDPCTDPKAVDVLQFAGWCALSFAIFPGSLIAATAALWRLLA